MGRQLFAGEDAAVIDNAEIPLNYIEGSSSLTQSEDLYEIDHGLIPQEGLEEDWAI